MIDVSLNRKTFYTDFPFRLGLRSSSENDSEEDFRYENFRCVSDCSFMSLLKVLMLYLQSSAFFRRKSAIISRAMIRSR